MRIGNIRVLAWLSRVSFIINVVVNFKCKFAHEFRKTQRCELGFERLVLCFGVTSQILIVSFSHSLLLSLKLDYFFYRLTNKNFPITDFLRHPCTLRTWFERLSVVNIQHTYQAFQIFLVFKFIGEANGIFVLRLLRMLTGDARGILKLWIDRDKSVMPAAFYRILRAC